MQNYANFGNHKNIVRKMLFCNLFFSFSMLITNHD